MPTAPLQSVSDRHAVSGRLRRRQQNHHRERRWLAALQGRKVLVLTIPIPALALQAVPGFSALGGLSSRFRRRLWKVVTLWRQRYRSPAV
jgi:hypothetical protein